MTFCGILLPEGSIMHAPICHNRRVRCRPHSSRKCRRSKLGIGIWTGAEADGADREGSTGAAALFVGAAEANEDAPQPFRSNLVWIVEFFSELQLARKDAALVVAEHRRSAEQIGAAGNGGVAGCSSKRERPFRQGHRGDCRHRIESV